MNNSGKAYPGPLTEGGEKENSPRGSLWVFHMRAKPSHASSAQLGVCRAWHLHVLLPPTRKRVVLEWDLQLLSHPVLI